MLTLGGKDGLVPNCIGSETVGIGAAVEPGRTSRVTDRGVARGGPGFNVAGAVALAAGPCRQRSLLGRSSGELVTGGCGGCCVLSGTVMTTTSGTCTDGGTCGGTCTEGAKVCTEAMVLSMEFGAGTDAMEFSSGTGERAVTVSLTGRGTAAGGAAVNDPRCAWSALWKDVSSSGESGAIVVFAGS